MVEGDHYLPKCWKWNTNQTQNLTPNGIKGSIPFFGTRKFGRREKNNLIVCQTKYLLYEVISMRMGNNFIFVNVKN